MYGAVTVFTPPIVIIGRCTPGATSTLGIGAASSAQ
eukprot:COSAG04_NODE_11_length_42922_cov_38.819700_11_plen_36_part_00